VMVTGSDADELFPLESSQHPAGVSGVETEPCPQRADLYALEPDLPKGPRLAHRPAPPEKLVGQRADTFGDCPVEQSDRRDSFVRNSLTLVRELRAVKGLRPHPPSALVLRTGHRVVRRG